MDAFGTMEVESLLRVQERNANKHVEQRID
jgi:hypothetical protein